MNPEKPEELDLEQDPSRDELPSASFAAGDDDLSLFDEVEVPGGLEAQPSPAGDDDLSLFAEAEAPSMDFFVLNPGAGSSEALGETQPVVEASTESDLDEGDLVRDALAFLEMGLPGAMPAWALDDSPVEAGHPAARLEAIAEAEAALEARAAAARLQAEEPGFESAEPAPPVVAYDEPEAAGPGAAPEDLASLEADLGDILPPTPEDFLDSGPGFEEVQEPEPDALPAVSLDALIDAVDAEMVAAPVFSATPQLPARSFDRGHEQYIVFLLGGTRYAAPILNVLEIALLPGITPVPHVPDWVRGVVNLRGDILSVIDLPRFLGLAGGSAGLSRILVARGGAESMTACLAVHRVEGIVRLAEQQIRPPAAKLQSAAASYLRGVCETERRTLAVLDVDKLFSSPEMCQFE